MGDSPNCQAQPTILFYRHVQFGENHKKDPNLDKQKLMYEWILSTYTCTFHLEI